MDKILKRLSVFVLKVGSLIGTLFTALVSAFLVGVSAFLLGFMCGCIKVGFTHGYNLIISCI